MIRSRGKVRMQIFTNRRIRKIRFSIFGRENDVKKEASKRLRQISQHYMYM
jgi:hypothetical protein